MSGAVLAILWRDGRPADAATVQRMLDGCPQRAVDGQAIWLGQNVAMAHQHFFVKPEDYFDQQPVVQADSDDSALVLSADLRLDNREELASLLGIPPADLREMGDATLLLHAYRRWGTDCVRRLLGDFAFVLWDGAEQQMFAACDPAGLRNLCYYADNNTIIIASEILHVLAFLNGNASVNEAKIADYLNRHTGHCEETLFEGIFYCLPAQCIQADRRGLWMWQFWDLTETPSLRYRRDEEYVEHFKALLFEAVRCRMRAAGPIGISLSGGLDSTTVATLAAQELPCARPEQERLLSFSYVFDELRSCDEREYIAPVVERWNLDATFVNGDGCWTLRNFDEWPVICDFVLYDNYRWLLQSLFDAVEERKLRVLLDGHFGDILYYGGQYWLTDLLRERKLGEAARAAGKIRVRWLYPIIKDNLRPLTPLAARLLYRRFFARPLKLFPGLHPDLAERAGIKQRYAAEQQRRITMSSDRWHRIRVLNTAPDVHGQLSVRRWYHTHRFEAESPLYDRRLAEFAAAVPAYVLERPPQTRHVLRTAMKGVLPENVRTRAGKTIFNPVFERGFVERERGVAEALLTDTEVVRRGYVRREWLGAQLERFGRWEDEGAELWRVFSLELWLRHCG